MTQDDGAKRAALDKATEWHENTVKALDVLTVVEERARRAVLSAALAITGEKWDVRRAGLPPAGAYGEITAAQARVAAKRKGGSGTVPGRPEPPEVTVTT